MELVFEGDTKEGSLHTIIMPSEAVEVSFGSLSHGAVKVGEVYGGLGDALKQMISLLYGEMWL